MVILTAILDGETYQIKQCDNGRSVLIGVMSRDPGRLIEDAVGPEVAAQICQLSVVPILLVTPDESADRVATEQVGADDSRNDHFALWELLAEFSAIPHGVAPTGAEM